MYRTEPEDLPENIVCDYFKVGFQKMKEQLNIDWETFFEECGDDITRCFGNLSIQRRKCGQQYRSYTQQVSTIQTK